MRKVIDRTELAMLSGSGSWPQSCGFRAIVLGSQPNEHLS
jgi:hypothetical protein